MRSVLAILNGILSKIKALENADKKQLKCVSGRVTFPVASSTGVQSVTVTFPEELPTVPICVMLDWNDNSNGSALYNNYVGKLQAASGSVTKAGFKAQTWRFSTSYAWYACWIAFYYDE